jgi:hypothetical protein
VKDSTFGRGDAPPPPPVCKVSQAVPLVTLIKLWEVEKYTNDKYSVLKFMQITVKLSVRAAKKTRQISITKSNWLQLFR